MTSEQLPFEIERSRIADKARVVACLVFGLPFLWLGMSSAGFLVIAIFLLGYALSLVGKMTDRRPAIVADVDGLRVFRWPGQSIRYAWNQITEISFRTMRVKHVLFIKADTATPPYTEIAGFDFKGRGEKVAERLLAAWEQNR